MSKIRPLIGISVGDPAGIGPEITAKALSVKEIYDICRPLVIAEKEMMKAATILCGLDQTIHVVSSPHKGKYILGSIDMLNLKNIKPQQVVYKKISAECGRASFEYIRKVIQLAMEGEIDATVTGPIHKEALNMAGYHQYAGHTEIYGDLTKTKDYAMMLIYKKFRVIHVTTHMSLKSACDHVKKERVYQVINLGNKTLKRMGIQKPRLAVAGLNPHAGESGLFGNEEIEEIIPAIEKAKTNGIDVQGPISSDTVFSKMQGGQFDLIVVMYHDQGHIPTKLLGFRYDEKTKKWDSISGVNVTCGLPIIRASVDHGTAFGKAGEGRANPESMVQAIKTAVQLSGDS
jgi:4-hydroxythreonine-4-phosphate dehydrogenase